MKNLEALRQKILNMIEVYPVTCGDPCFIDAIKAIDLSQFKDHDQFEVFPSSEDILAERLFEADAIQKLKFPSPQDDTLSPAFWADVANRSRLAASAFASSTPLQDAHSL